MPTPLAPAAPIDSLPVTASNPIGSLPESPQRFEKRRHGNGAV
jgi:hypothetical protein